LNLFFVKGQDGLHTLRRLLPHGSMPYVQLVGLRNAGYPAPVSDLGQRLSQSLPKMDLQTGKVRHKLKVLLSIGCTNHWSLFNGWP